MTLRCIWIAFSSALGGRLARKLWLLSPLAEDVRLRVGQYLRMTGGHFNRCTCKRSLLMEGQYLHTWWALSLLGI